MWPYFIAKCCEKYNASLKVFKHELFYQSSLSVCLLEPPALGSSLVETAFSLLQNCRGEITR